MLPPDLRLLLGDTSDDDPDLRARCAADERLLVTSTRGRSPHTDAGVAVRRLVLGGLHQIYERVA